MEAPLRVEGPLRLTVDAVIGVPSMSAFEKSAVPETVTAAEPEMVPPDCARVPMVIMVELALRTPPPVIDTVPMLAEATEFWPPCSASVPPPVIPPIVRTAVSAPMAKRVAPGATVADAMFTLSLRVTVPLITFKVAIIAVPLIVKSSVAPP